MSDLERIINDAFEDRDNINVNTAGDIRNAVDETLNKLDSGSLRVCEKINNEWQVNQWIKKAILLSFRLNDNEIIKASHATWFDKVESKTANWTKDDHLKAGFRYVPDAVVRKSAFIAKGVVLMPSFVNLGAYVDEGTMIDTWATVGSCAQIGKNVHLSGGVGIGGVLEPPSAMPVIIEDGAFIGSRAIIVEGVRVGKGAVIGANVTITSSTPVIDVSGKEAIEHKGVVPENSVVIPGTRPKKFPSGEFEVQCALIIGQRKESTNEKTSLNEALRTFGVDV